ncbi:MAG TPA: DUF3568 family protein [Nitrospiraceae bacterium]|nr:DUF3568 family protein [Nitrospiraceae bacterium]
MNDHARMFLATRVQAPGAKSFFRIADGALCVLVGLLCSGCLALAVGAAGGAAGAVYVMGKLKDEVDYPVPVVHEAAVAAMQDLELKVAEDKVDKLSAHMESAFSDGTHIWIDIDSVSDSRSQVIIRVGVMGDEVRSRRIYDTIKRNLPRSQALFDSRRLSADRGFGYIHATS